MSNKPVITVENVGFSYSGKAVLEKVNLTVNKLDFVWVVGPNGGGKTTLMKIMLGLLQPTEGVVRILGQSPEKSRHNVGYMPQNISFDRWFPVNVMDVVLMGRLVNLGKIGGYGKTDHRAAGEALNKVGLFDLRFRSFSSLSGGEQKRLLIARALASQPQVLFLDEPTANLDLKADRELFKVLQDLNRNLTIVLISHDPTIVSASVKRVICVNRRVHEHPTCEAGSDFISEFYGDEIRMIRHDQLLREDQDND